MAAMARNSNDLNEKLKLMICTLHVLSEVSGWLLQTPDEPGDVDSRHARRSARAKLHSVGAADGLRRAASDRPPPLLSPSRAQRRRKAAEAPGGGHRRPQGETSLGGVLSGAVAPQGRLKRC